MDLICPICNNSFKRQPYRLLRLTLANKVCCSKECDNILRKKTRLRFGSKYSFNRDYFKKVTSDIGAYILGWIASDGTVTKKGWCISIHKKDVSILEKIKNEIDPNLKITPRKLNKMVSLTVNSVEMANDICTLLKISYGKKSNLVEFPDISEDLKKHFLRGYFDGDGSITCGTERQYPYATIRSNSVNMLKAISSLYNIPYNIVDRDTLLYYGGLNALDFLGKIYEESTIHMTRKYEEYLSWCYWNPTLKKGEGIRGKNQYFNWSKTDSSAIPPSKTNISDSGYDLTIIKMIKKVGKVEFYDTCIKVSPAPGYYFDVVPRSSIAKTGYIMANSIGIIDRSYRGNIIIALIKIDDVMPNISIPVKIAQMIPREIVHQQCIETIDELDDTARNAGGFGSTGV